MHSANPLSPKTFFYNLFHTTINLKPNSLLSFNTNLSTGSQKGIRYFYIKEETVSIAMSRVKFQERNQL